MLIGIYRFILAQFASLISPIFALYRLLIPTQVEYGINSPSPTQDQHDKNANKSNDDGQQAAGLRVDDKAMRGFPPIEEQLEARIKEFIDSIDKDAVCRLASRHNSHKSCRVIGHDRGSFNVCFFVLFDTENVTWVVRIPLEPVVCDVWAKVQSEVATMRRIDMSSTTPRFGTGWFRDSGVSYVRLHFGPVAQSEDSCERNRGPTKTPLSRPYRYTTTTLQAGILRGRFTDAGPSRWAGACAANNREAWKSPPLKSNT
ncbi:phosphotransferase enzyme family [Fusarium agapanthi]|uniref:Phosphotransferase enzyme family n=1 Tax=Fusarium agapanthi TaxID=1803897 RepID=A0A9P5B2C1_9HYPO|nr:phosphotransferase enzyme family [Fusarium agapanthi]